jgi:pyruvate formate lyase activating enzyme
VVLTGGEPTLHKRLPDIISVLRNKGLKIKLDTNGLLPEMINLCKPDYLAMDLKTDPAQYARLGGEYNNIPERIFQSIEIVKSMGTNAEIRITAAPPLIDDNTIKTIADLVNGVSKIYLQQIVTNNNLLDNAYVNIKPYPVTVLENFRSLLLGKVKQCTIRGFD